MYICTAPPQKKQKKNSPRPFIKCQKINWENRVKSIISICLVHSIVSITIRTKLFNTEQ